jgi:hypothetical protein
VRLSRKENELKVETKKRESAAVKLHKNSRKIDGKICL